MVESELWRNYAENCCEVWDTDTNQLIGKPCDWMCVELGGFDGEAWTPVEVRGKTLRDGGRGTSHVWFLYFYGTWSVPKVYPDLYILTNDVRMDNHKGLDSKAYYLKD